MVEGKSAWVGIAIATHLLRHASASTGSITTTTATSTPSWPSALTIKESNVPEAQFNEDGRPHGPNVAIRERGPLAKL